MSHTLTFERTADVWSRAKQGRQGCYTAGRLCRTLGHWLVDDDKYAGGGKHYPPSMPRKNREELAEFAHRRMRTRVRPSDQ